MTERKSSKKKPEEIKPQENKVEETSDKVKCICPMCWGRGHGGAYGYQEGRQIISSNGRPVYADDGTPVPFYDIICPECHGKGWRWEKKGTRTPQVGINTN
jgi:hypothetical protein